MNQTAFIIRRNRPLTRDVFEMRLEGDASAVTRPGQFINLALAGLFLRRPISVCDWDGAGLTILYKVVGQGTAQMSGMRPGAAMEALVGLGNGFDVDACPENPLLVGGGVGVPPLYGLARRLVDAGKHPAAVLGFNRAEEVFYRDEFEALGLPVAVATLDGRAGVKGLVTDAMPAGAYVCCCGPEPMLRAVHARAAGGQFSFEARMGCGFGACMGCTCQTIAGPKRICREGPVLFKEEILW